MSTTHGPIEPTAGAPGAIPQAPRPFGTGPDPRDAPETFSRSGDTDVVFRMERDLPLVHRLREAASGAADRLLDNWRMVVAAGLGLLALVALAVVVGGAYRSQPTSPPTPRTVQAAPAATQPAAVAPVTAARTAAPPAPPHPARTRSHPGHARGHAATPRKGGGTRPGAPPVHRSR
jgi:hypothetical protein